MGTVGAIAAHAFLFVDRLADVVPFDIAAAWSAGANLITCRAFVIEAGVKLLVLVGQKARARPSHRFIIVVTRMRGYPLDWVVALARWETLPAIHAQTLVES